MPASGAAQLSLAGMIAAHAHEIPDQPAVIFPADKEPDEVLTYAELARRSWALAGWLGSELAPGSRVMLALPTGRDSAVAFVACLAAGMVAVHTSAPDGYPNARRRAAGIVRDCGAALILASPADLAAVSEWAHDSGVRGVTCAAVPDTGLADSPPAPSEAGTSNLAFLQYTSGSTGNPKGVMITHGNLLANMEQFARRIGLDAETRYGGWIPLYHDMGLVTLLCVPLWLGGTTVLMRPGAFARRPIEWLRMIDRYRVGMSAGPNFAYDLCVRTVTDDQAAALNLSGWRFAVNGSEPIHAPTMAKFTQKFAIAGFRPQAMVPGYGMAEATVFVSAKRPGAPPVVITADPAQADHGLLVPVPGVSGGSRSIVSCGQPSGFDLRIVDPDTGAALEYGRIGEIWLRGASVSAGYWARPQESAATFNAITADGQSGWLRTGDLGTWYEGQLYVTGRLKEMLIVHGRNLFPQDLEAEARTAHPALTGLAGAAFSVSAPGERPVIVHEVNARAARDDLPGVALAVSARLTATFAIPARNVVLVRRGGVRKTTSGKIERTAMRKLFIAGDLTALHAELEPAVAQLLSGQPAARHTQPIR